MTKKGNLFIVSGPTAAGKGTICAKLCERRQDIKVSISCATRAPRNNEVNGVHYFFINDEEFDRMIDAGELLEHADVHGKKYGTPRKFVMDMLDVGSDVILEIDVQGASQVMSHAGISLTEVFVLPPSKDILLERLRNRGTETEEQIAVRIKNVEAELAEAQHYGYVIINSDLESAVRCLEAIIDASHARREEHEALLHELCQQFQEEG